MPVLFGVRCTSKDPNDNKHWSAASIVWSVDIVYRWIKSKEKMNTAVWIVILRIFSCSRWSEIIVSVLFNKQHWKVSNIWQQSDILLIIIIFIRARSIRSRRTAAYKAYCATLNPLPWFKHSYFRHQVPPHPYDTRDRSSEKWNCGRECWLVILSKCRLTR
jgi:hypothetical protein